jgi:hypothetical protein
MAGADSSYATRIAADMLVIPRRSLKQRAYKKNLSFAVFPEFFCEVPGFAPFAAIGPKFFWRTGGGDLV